MPPKHKEGDPARVKGAKRGEHWIWHILRYVTPEGTVRIRETTVKVEENKEKEKTNWLQEWENRQ